MKKYKLVLILILGISFNLMCVKSSNIYIQTIKEDEIKVIKGKQAYKNQDPFIINGNSELVEFAKELSLQGDGSEASPYIIENLKIVSDDAIRIYNVNLSVNIENCILNGGHGYAMHLASVSNIKIESNSICDSYHGIDISNSNSLSIINNNIYNITQWGIRTERTVDSVIEGNEITWCGGGIDVYLSSMGLDIKDNLIVDSHHTGIYLSYSNKTTVSDNWMENIPDLGLGMSYVKRITVKGNNIINSSQGIASSSSVENIIQNNTIYGNNNSGIILRQGNSHNIIKNNIFLHNAFQFCIVFSPLDPQINNTIKWNDFISKISDSESQVADGSENSNANTFESNCYWHINTSRVDLDEDGHIDSSYKIYNDTMSKVFSSNKDQFPLTYPVQFKGHLLSLPRMVTPIGEETLNETINVTWIPAFDSLKENVTYKVFIWIEVSKEWELLSEGLTDTYYEWDTSRTKNGEGYKIKVVATSGELETETISVNTFKINNNAVSGFLSISTVLFLVIVAKWTRRKGKRRF